MKSIVKLLSSFLVLLVVLSGCNASLDTDPDWDLDERFANEYEFSSLKEMERYLIKEQLPDGIHKKLNRVFPLPVTGLGYIPFQELFEEQDGVLSASVVNKGLFYTDIDMVIDVEADRFSVYDFVFRYTLDGAQVRVSRNVEYWGKRTTELFADSEIKNYTGFDDVENGVLLRRCGETEVVYEIREQQISSVQLITADRSIQVLGDDDGINIENKVIAPLFSEDDSVFKKAVERISKAASAHGVVTPKDVSVKMSRDRYLKAVHGGAISIQDLSVFYAGTQNAVIVTFEETKIARIESVAIPEKSATGTDFEKILPGSDLNAVLQAVGMPFRKCPLEKQEALDFKTVEKDIYRIHFDASGKVSKVVNQTEFDENVFY